MFHCINICKIPWEMLKTVAFGLGFLHLHWDLVNVNAWNNVFVPCIKPLRNINTITVSYSVPLWLTFILPFLNCRYASKKTEICWNSGLQYKRSFHQFLNKTKKKSLILRKETKKHKTIKSLNIRKTNSYKQPQHIWNIMHTL